MQLKLLENKFNVYKLYNIEGIDLKTEFTFLSITDDEISFVCPQSTKIDSFISLEAGWSAFKITGTLDFSLVGILAKIAGILADNQISIFAISTFNTDYILVKEEKTEQAADALRGCGYVII